MVQEPKGRFFLQCRLVWRRNRHPTFLGRVLNQLVFRNVRQVEEFVEAIDEADRAVAAFRHKQQLPFGKANLARLDAIGFKPPSRQFLGEPAHFGPVILRLVRHDDGDDALLLPR